MLGTRPDIAFSIQQLSQFSSEPLVTHMQAAKRVLRYLQGTKRLGITYSGSGLNETFHGYTNADYAGDINKRQINWRLYLPNGRWINLLEQQETINGYYLNNSC